jgi:SulP family sulfate permease
LAGLTVAVVDLPQSMAFAVMAGVPPVYGLYTSIVLGSLGSLFTSSPYLSVGATTTQSLLVAAVVSRLTSDPRVYLQLVFGLAMLKGLVQLAFASARMGRLVRYVSRSVMVPFAAAAGSLMVAGQLPALLGLPREPAQRFWPGVPGAIERLALHAHDVNLHAVGVGIGTLCVLLLGSRFSRAAPGPLLAVIGSGLFVWLAGWTEADAPLVGRLPSGLPAFALPRLDGTQLEALLPGAVALALLGMLESVMIGRTVAGPAGQSVDPDQELFSQGLANLIGSFLQCIPGSGSFSRTALQQRAGARTRVAGVFCALFNAVVLLALARFASTIPLAALAAILLFIGVGLIDVRALRRMARASRPDAVVCFTTLIAALALPLTYSIYVGIFSSLALYLRHAGRLHLQEIVPTESGGFEERALPLTSRKQLVLVQLDGDLFFAVADDLSEQLGRLERTGVSVAIFRLKRTRWIDASVMLALEQFVLAMHTRGGHVLLCGVRPELRQRLAGFGLEALIGPENVFATEPGVFASAKRALGRARELTGFSLRPERSLRPAASAGG